MILIRPLFFHFLQAFGIVKGFVNLITGKNNCVSVNYTEFSRSNELLESNMPALNQYIFQKNQVVCHQRVPKF